MHTWYHAVCDTHKQIIQIMVNSPKATTPFLNQQDVQIRTWLEAHHRCELKMIHRDDQLDATLEGGYYDPIQKLPEEKQVEQCPTCKGFGRIGRPGGSSYMCGTCADAHVIGAPGKRTS